MVTSALLLYSWGRLRRGKCSSLCRHALEVGNALLERVVLLLGRDGLAHVGHDPVGHVLLLHAPHRVGQGQLVVQPHLHLKENDGEERGDISGWKSRSQEQA